MPKTVKVVCHAPDVLALERLLDFQGALKTLTPEAAEKLKLSILRYGFSAPVFVWVHGDKHYILDGHQRVQVLRTLQTEGYTIPPVPVVHVSAPDVKTAKIMVLTYVSQYGKISPAGLEAFAEQLNADDMNIVIDLPDFHILTGGHDIQFPDAPDIIVDAAEAPLHKRFIITYANVKERAWLAKTLGIPVTAGQHYTAASLQNNGTK